MPLNFCIAPRGFKAIVEAPAPDAACHQAARLHVVETTGARPTRSGLGS